MWTDLKLLAPPSICHSTMNSQTQCTFFCWVTWSCGLMCSHLMLESSLSYPVSSRTSKVSVIKKALVIYWWQEWMGGWMDEWVNEWCNSASFLGIILSNCQLWKQNPKFWYLRKFLSLSFLHLFFSDPDFLSPDCLSLSCSLSQEKFPILLN